MQRSGYVGSDHAVLARIAAQQKADASQAYVKDVGRRQAEASWVAKSGEVQTRVSLRERCVRRALRCAAPCPAWHRGRRVAALMVALGLRRLRGQLWALRGALWRPR